MADSPSSGLPTPKRLSRIPAAAASPSTGSPSAISSPSNIRKPSATSSPSNGVFIHKNEAARMSHSAIHTPSRLAALAPRAANGIPPEIENPRSSSAISGKPSVPRTSIGPRKSVGDLRPPSSLSSSRPQTPGGPGSSSSSVLAHAESPDDPKTPMLHRKGPSSSNAAGHRLYTPSTSARSGRQSAKFDIIKIESSGSPVPPIPPVDPRFAAPPQKTRGQLTLTFEDLGAEMEVKQGPEQGCRGVLRFLGTIAGKGDVTYAGIELLAEWQGQGKNDGTVGGVQYFATAPRNGMFLLPSRLHRISKEAPTDAVARPQSALSGRSSRGPSEYDFLDRPPSTTLGRRNSAVPPTTPTARAAGHASGRTSASFTTPRTPSARPFVTPRKSVFEEIREDSIAQQRAKASADKIAEAQSRIREGSRAAEMMQLQAKEVAVQLESAAVSKPRQSLTATNTQTSPLKTSLTNTTNRQGRVSLGGPTTPGLIPRSRKSVGPEAAHIPFRPVLKPRASGSMRPPLPPHRPVTPTSRPASAASLGGRSSVEPGRPSSSLSGSSDRRSVSALSTRQESLEDEDAAQIVEPGFQKAKSMALLQQMDLDATPKRRAPTPRSIRSSSRSSTRSVGAASEADAYAEAVVPLSIYEEIYNDLQTNAAETAELRRSHDEMSRSNGLREQEHRSQLDNLERERSLLREEKVQHQKLVEEERQVEREDERRRRGEIEARERETKKALEAVQTALRRAQDEAGRKETEHLSKISELELQLKESSDLVDKLKNAVALRHQAQGERDETDTQLKAKDAELGQLRSRIERLEGQLVTERGNLLKEIDELKDAGQETITLYELRLEEAQEEKQAIVADMEDRLLQLQTKAQEAIATAEAQKEEALRQSKASTVMTGSAAAIDHQTLQEAHSHDQAKILQLEDELAELHLTLENEREAFKKRKDKMSDVEAKLKADFKKAKSELQQSSVELKDSATKRQELQNALEERSKALESERAELEMLRAEIAAAQDTGGSLSSSVITPTRSQLSAELELLRKQLRSSTDQAALPNGISDHAASSARSTEAAGAPQSHDSSASNAEQASPATVDSDSGNGTSEETSLSTTEALQLTSLRSTVSALSKENAELHNKLREIRDTPKIRDGPIPLTVPAAKNGQAEHDRVAHLESEASRAATESSREIADLEALVEAGMWAREELEAKVKDLERKVQREKERVKRLENAATANAAAAIDAGLGLGLGLINPLHSGVPSTNGHRRMSVAEAISSQDEDSLLFLNQNRPPSGASDLLRPASGEMRAGSRRGSTHLKGPSESISARLRQTMAEVSAALESDSPRLPTAQSPSTLSVPGHPSGQHAAPSPALSHHSGRVASGATTDVEDELRTAPTSVLGLEDQFTESSTSGPGLSTNHGLVESTETAEDELVFARAVEGQSSEEDVERCDDCGSTDHKLEDCPLLDEIF